MNRSTYTVAAALVMVAAAGVVAVGQEKGKNILKDPNKPASWRLEQHAQGKATM